MGAGGVDIVESVYAATFADEAELRALFGEIAKTVGVVACGVKTEWAAGDGSMEQTWFGLPAEFEQAFVAEYWREDPWTQATRHVRAGTFQLSRQMIPDAELRRTRFHAELCVPFGLHDAMGACLIRNDERYVTFGMMRPSDAKGDGSREAKLGAQLLPHLTRVMRLRHEASRLRTRALGARAGIDALPFAALVVDRAGRLKLTNPLADALLRKRDGLVSTRAGLAALSLADTRALHHAIGATLDTSAPVSSARDVLAIRRPDQRPLAIVLTPLLGQPGEPLAVLHVLDPYAGAEPTEGLLRTLFGLSPAETRVALSIARGHTPDETATKLRRSVTTIRSQLRAVFQKTHTTRQAELTRLLVTLGARGG
jgi:DNA-binding CsgD family transcriptional regulator